MALSLGAEEAGGFFAKMLDHDYTKKEVFCRNFFTDWRKVRCVLWRPESPIGVLSTECMCVCECVCVCVCVCMSVNVCVCVCVNVCV